MPSKFMSTCGLCIVLSNFFMNICYVRDISAHIYIYNATQVGIDVSLHRLHACKHEDELKIIILIKVKLLPTYKGYSLLFCAYVCASMVTCMHVLIYVCVFARTHMYGTNIILTT